MTDLLPRAWARAPAAARLGAWHADAGQRIDGPLRWAIGLASAVAAAHGVIFAGAFALLLWNADIALPSQLVYVVFWMFLAGIAGGLHLFLTFTFALPIALAGRLLAPAPRVGAVAGAAGTAAVLVVVQPVIAWSWVTLAGFHDVPVPALTAVSALAGLVWGSWLPRLRSGRA